MPSPKDPEARDRWIENLRRSHRGLTRSEESKRKQGDWSRRTKTGVPRPDMLGNRNPMRRPEIAAKLSAAQQGRVIAPETRAKIGATLQGRYMGEANPNWAGETAGYVSIHKRAHLRLPLVCAHADATCKGPLQCALRKDAPADSIRMSATGVRFSVAPADIAYVRLCQSHHTRYDGRGGRRKKT